MQRYRNLKIRVCGKNSFPLSLSFFERQEIIIFLHSITFKKAFDSLTMFPLFMIHVNLSQSHTQRGSPPPRFVKSGFQVFSLITLSLILQREIFYIVLNIFKLLTNNESTYNKILEHHVQSSMISRKKVDFLILKKKLEKTCFSFQGKDVIKKPVITL